MKNHLPLLQGFRIKLLRLSIILKIILDWIINVYGRLEEALKVRRDFNNMRNLLLLILIRLMSLAKTLKTWWMKKNILILPKILKIWLGTKFWEANISYLNLTALNTEDLKEVLAISS